MSASRPTLPTLRRRPWPTAQAGGTRLIALTVPGLGAHLAAELESLPDVWVEDLGFDGRSDVVLFTADGPDLRRFLTVRVAEDILVEVGRTLRGDGDRPQWISSRLWRPERVRHALAARAKIYGTIRGRAAFRVVARVLQERAFRRSDLRRYLTATIQRHQPQWRLAAHTLADVEVWVVEYRPGRIVAGLRASTIRMRDGRAVERAGALRPVVAAAMLRLAGDPTGLVLDPCCGCGAILAQAAHVGWQPVGVDLDPDAVGVARRNVPRASVEPGDVRQLPLPDQSVGVSVSNLPFGRRFHVQGSMDEWLRAALAELARVTRPGGRVVLMAPHIPYSAEPDQLRLGERIPIRLLGARTTIWVYDRR